MNHFQEYYHTVDQTAVAEYKDKGSRFIAYVFPVETADEFKTHLNNLKKEHPKANHHCFGYRIGFDNNHFRVSDDGEPSGTAGKPILGQIDSRKLTNVLIIVVRYFGGTLLGVPGLIQAYKTAAAMVLQVVPVLQKPITQNVQMHFDYTLLNDVMRHIKTLNVEIVKQEMSLFCSMVAKVPVNRLTEFENLIKALRVDFKLM